MRARQKEPKSGSVKRPQRRNTRCSVQEGGRFDKSISRARQILRERFPEMKQIDMADCMHRVIIPTFEKVCRAVDFGSSAEQEAAKVYLEEFVRKEDYIKNRKDRYQIRLNFGRG